MKYLNKYDKFLNEETDFNWEDYGEKRQLIEEVLPYLINKIRPLKQFGKRIFSDMAHGDFGGGYQREKQIKYGLDPDLMFYIFNKINTIGSDIGPNLAGEFKSVKRNLWDKILGRPGLIITKGTSIIDNMINLLPEFSEEMLKKEKDLNVQKMVDEIWAVHPNNPKNKQFIEQQVAFDNAVKTALNKEPDTTEKDYESDESREDIEKETKALTDAIDKINPFKNMMKNESREEWYDDYEWVDHKGEIRIGKESNEKFYIAKANKYRQMMINLSKMVSKYRQEVIDTLEPYMDYLDEKVYQKLLEKIDSLYEYINGDTSDIKGIKNQHQFSIVEMLNMYINKDTSNFKGRF